MDESETKPLVVAAKPKRTKNHWSLNDTIDAMGMGKFQMAIFLLCGVAEAADGIQQLSVSFLLHYLGNLWSLTTQGKALIGTFSGAGMLVGALAWGVISDRKGRRFAFTGTLLMSGSFGLLTAAAPNYVTFLIFRFLLAIGIGGNVPLAFTILTEFTPRLNRGGYLTMLEGWWSFGAVCSCILAWVVLPNIGWHWYMVFTSLPAFCLGVLAYFKMPESPRYLIINGEIESAQTLLHQMALRNEKPHLSHVQLTRHQQDKDKEKEREKEQAGSTFLQLFSPSVRTTTIMLFFIFFLISYGCGVFMWMPVLLEGKNLEPLSMYRSMVIMALSQVPGVITAAYLVERVGRKLTIAMFFLMGIVFTCFFAVSEKEIWVVLATIFMEFFLAGTNGSLAAYTVEFFPTTLRSTAMGTCSALSRLSSVINPNIWAVLLDLGETVAIFGGAFALFLAMLLTIFLPRETKGLQIQDHLKKE